MGALSGERAPRRIALGAVALYAALGAAFAVFGRVNGDEGWYLVAARRVVRGELPYADFAFTQMPLLPYVYGLPQLAAPGLLTGRATSLALSVAALALCVRVAQRLGGWGTAAAVAVLVTGALTPLYFSVLVKTYALAAFLLAATLAALAAEGPRRLTDPLAVACAVALALTRTSGLPLALGVCAWCIARAPDSRTRARCLAVAAAGALAAAALLLRDPAAAAYGLFESHRAMWADAGVARRAQAILADRVPRWLLLFAPFWALAAAAAAAALRVPAARAWVRSVPAVPIVFLGALAFLGTHLLPGQFAPREYFAPALPVLVTTSAVVLARALPRRATARGAAAAVALLAAVAALQPPVTPFLVGPGDPGSVFAVRRLARVVQERTAPGEEVLALWHQAVVVEAGRDAPPDAAMGFFSYADVTSARAERLHLLNTPRLASLLRARRPAAVVLGDVDRGAFRRGGWFSKRRRDPEAVLGPLREHYALVHTGPGPGLLGPDRVRVYLRRAAPPAAPPGGP